MACVEEAKGGMPDPLFAGFPDGTGEADERDAIVGGEGGAELKVIKVATVNTSTWAGLTD